MSVNIDLSGKTALITGATRGIGKAIADNFIEVGAKVILTGTKQNEIDNLNSENKNQAVKWLMADFSTFDSIESFINELIFFKSIDICINNAGINIIKPLSEISNQEYILRTSLDIISNYFSCGGYFFSNALEYIKNFHKYEEMQIAGEFFISNVIDIMIDDNHVFHPKECTNLKDWGTFEDWINYKKSKSCYFFDIDGVIYENGSEFWEPKWGENKVLLSAKNKINELFNSGNQIILTTSRPEKFRNITIQQLKKDQVQYHQLVMGVFHGTRYLINDYSNSNPYPVAKSINTKRNSCDFIKMID